MRQNNKMFSVLFSGLCACWPAESLEQPQADGSQEASGSRLADCHSWLGEQGLCPSYLQMPPAPPTYAGTEITAQNNENLKGERRGRKGMESLFIFSDNEIAKFQQSYPGKSFCKLL